MSLSRCAGWATSLWLTRLTCHGASPVSHPFLRLLAHSRHSSGGLGRGRPRSGLRVRDRGQPAGAHPRRRLRVDALPAMIPQHCLAKALRRRRGTRATAVLLGLVRAARRRRHRHWCASFADPPQQHHRRAGLPTLLLTASGAAAHPGRRGRAALAHRRILPRRQRPRRPRSAPSPALEILAPLDHPGHARSRLPGRGHRDRTRHRTHTSRTGRFQFMPDRPAPDVTTPKRQCPRFTALAAPQRKVTAKRSGRNQMSASRSPGQEKVPVKLGARACLNPLDQATTAFSDALWILLGVTLGSVGFLPGATHVSIVELHGLGHHLTPFGRRQHSCAPRQNTLGTS